MSLRSRKLLFDILGAGRQIETFLANVTFDQFPADALVRSAVERQFEIIGEAMRRLRDSDRAAFDRLGDAQRIVDFRNLLAHGYDAIDAAVVWQIAIDKLPILLAEVQRLDTDLSGP